MSVYYCFAFFFAFFLLFGLSRLTLFFVAIFLSPVLLVRMMSQALDAEASAFSSTYLISFPLFVVLFLCWFFSSGFFFFFLRLPRPPPLPMPLLWLFSLLLLRATNSYNSAWM